MLKNPSKSTLNKYGLSLDDWLGMAKAQNNCCAVCKKPQEMLCVDHQHVRGFKKMKPDQKKRFVRALLCSFCNYRIVGRLTLPAAKAVYEYLNTFEQKKLIFKVKGVDGYGIKTYP